MSYPNILERSSLLVHKYFIYLVQGIQPLHHMPKHRMFPIEVLDTVRKRDKELTSAATERLTFYGRRDGHGNGTLLRVLQTGYDLWNEITWRLPSSSL
jgi:hypothetical protein